MDFELKLLRIGLIVQMVAGFFLSIFIALFLGLMATDAPSSTTAEFYAGALAGFAVIFVPVVAVPIIALFELKNIHRAQRLVFNIINAIICSFFFFPFTLFHFVIIWKIRNSIKNSTPRLETVATPDA